MTSSNEHILRKTFKDALERDRNTEAVISVILEIFVNASHSTFKLKNTFIVVKEELIAYFYGQSISAELLFNKMWRNKNRLIQLISTFLIPIFFKPGNFRELKTIIPYLRNLSDIQITRLTGYNLAQALKRKPYIAVSLLRILSASDSIWERILALHLGEELKTVQSPEIDTIIKSLENKSNLILKKFMPVHFRTDEEILNSIQLQLTTNGI